MDAIDKNPLRQRAAALANRTRLRSGWVPPQAEAQTLREMASELEKILSQMTEDIAEADREVERLQQALRQTQSRRATLTEERARMREQVSSCLALAAPVRRLPGEVLSQIFTYVLDHPVFFTEELRQLIAVCHAWRNVVLSTSSLWSTVMICCTMNDLRLSDTRGHAAFVRAQLRWSANRPLSICLLIDTGNRSLASQLWAAAREEVYRWKRLTVKAEYPPASYAASWVNHLPLCLPILEYLEFSGVASPPPFKVFVDAPRLRHLRIDTKFEPWGMDFPHSWRLTTLHLGNTLTVDCLSALKGTCATLKELNLGYIDVDDPLQHATAPVTLPLLEKLCITGAAVRCIGSSLIFPSVHHLCINGLHRESECEDTVAMVQRASATITTLELTPFLVSQQAVLHLLKGLPTVTHLVLYTYFTRAAFGEGFFHDLTPSVDNPDCPFPNLRRLTAELGRTKNVGEISFAQLLPMLQDLRSQEITVGERTYPALTERTLKGIPGDALFDSGSDTEDEDYNPSDEDSEALESDADSDCLTEESDEP
ncbi:uncharacterized protein SCHCODRAFT_02506983 [Schizophyllum commune H4-8]|uniref:uncharacterized protein n=1 Tax=Schizophyllum commune (strain H4-8 / FGSC 9210) TaxID=578458 RepID=UPI00215FE20A|nr:uncharacterized protein SCHCODRAFT_02506983 [Schizophyllum commune H4-8]KAI5890214.1 hypothetical protein SCHCODRAFT_02506983 [Schizophyllum commune H4-8]